MNPSYAGPLGIAAAVIGTLTHSPTALADTPSPAEPPQTVEAATSTVAPVDPEPDPLDAEPRHGERELETGEMLKLCDVRCQVLNFTEESIPDVGASQLLFTVLYPGKAGLSIPKAGGTVAVTFTVMPTQIARGKGVVAMGEF